MATYGGDISETVNGEGIFTKYYSEDGTSEIIRNNQTGKKNICFTLAVLPMKVILSI